MYSSSTPNRNTGSGSVYSGYAASSNLNKSYLGHNYSAVNGGGSEYTGYSRVTGRTMGTATSIGGVRFNTKTAIQKGLKYFRRLLHINQMDFEFGTWQMIYLLVSPQKVYRNFQYRKQTKDQFARDDPAFLVLLACLLSITSICFGFLMGLSVYKTLKLLVWIVAIDCIGSGMVIATFLKHCCNRYLRTASTEDVEWAYAFDVHLNAFIPLLTILHGFQLLFVTFIEQNYWFSVFIGNTFWLVALTYYFYITFLGYSALQFLKKTTIFLIPVLPLFAVYLLSLVIKWNFTSSLIRFYAARL